jgi:ribose 5-phosphate isomerase RpiB
MRIALASDHAGFSLKKEIEALLQADGHETRDFGVEKYRRRAREGAGDLRTAPQAVAARLTGRSSAGGELGARPNWVL